MPDIYIVNYQSKSIKKKALPKPDGDDYPDMLDYLDAIDKYKGQIDSLREYPCEGLLPEDDGREWLERRDFIFHHQWYDDKNGKWVGYFKTEMQYMTGDEQLRVIAIPIRQEAAKQDTSGDEKKKSYVKVFAELRELIGPHWDSVKCICNELMRDVCEFNCPGSPGYSE
jgi:hypothetical protein